MVEEAKRIIQAWTVSDEVKNSVIDVQRDAALQAWARAKSPYGSNVFFVSVCSPDVKNVQAAVHIRVKNLSPDSDSVRPFFCLVVPLHEQEHGTDRPEYIVRMARHNKKILDGGPHMSWKKLGLVYGSTQGSFQIGSEGVGGWNGFDLLATGLVMHPSLSKAYARAADAQRFSPQVVHCNIATAYAGGLFLKEDTGLRVQPVEPGFFQNATVNQPVAVESFSSPMSVAA